TLGQDFQFTKTLPGTYIVTLTVTDKDGASDADSALILSGTTGNDTRTIHQSDITTPVNEVVYLALGGNDSVTVGTDVTLPVVFAGGDGSDPLTAGASDAVLLGGSGADSLVGGSGDDTFFGQHGDDTMAGGSGHNVYKLVPG